jgi:hypothetical protein
MIQNPNQLTLFGGARPPFLSWLVGQLDESPLAWPLHICLAKRGTLELPFHHPQRLPPRTQQLYVNKMA